MRGNTANKMVPCLGSKFLLMLTVEPLHSIQHILDPLHRCFRKPATSLHPEIIGARRFRPEQEIVQDIGQDRQGLMITGLRAELVYQGLEGFLELAKQSSNVRLPVQFALLYWADMMQQLPDHVLDSRLRQRQ